MRFVVENAIDGHQNRLKEYVIGAEVYDRKPPYHPSQNSIVRTEARRLRCKLKEYYETDGKDDPRYVDLRSGSYIPVSEFKETLINSNSSTNADHHSSPGKHPQLRPRSYPFVTSPELHSPQPMRVEFQMNWPLL